MYTKDKIYSISSSGHEITQMLVHFYIGCSRNQFIGHIIVRLVNGMHYINISLLKSGSDDTLVVSPEDMNLAKDAALI